MNIPTFFPDLHLRSAAIVVHPHSVSVAILLKRIRYRVISWVAMAPFLQPLTRGAHASEPPHPIAG